MSIDIGHVAWFFGLRNRLIFESSIPESRFYCELELDFVVCDPVVFVIFQRLLRELTHAGNRILDDLDTRDYFLSFGDGGEVYLHLLSDCRGLMLFGQLALVTPCWTCFLGLARDIEVRLAEEERPVPLVLLQK